MHDQVWLPSWNDGYPDPERLRREVSAMTEAIVEALLDNIPKDEIRAIYLKGSAKKRWDTPIDYVPEASDLDLHLWFHDDDGERTHIGRLDQALTIQHRSGLPGEAPKPHSHSSPPDHDHEQHDAQARLHALTTRHRQSAIRRELPGR